MRTKLTPAERAKFTARRKDAYEAKHPETRHGGDRSSRQSGDTKRFTDDTAERTGHSERSVQRDATRGDRIADDVLEDIQGTALDKGVVLDEIAATPRADLSVQERADQIAEWVRLTSEKLGQNAQVASRGRAEGRGHTGGVSAASRELGIERTEVRRAEAIASIPDDARAAADLTAGHRVPDEPAFTSIAYPTPTAVRIST